MAEGLSGYLSIVDERIEEVKNSCQKLQRSSYYNNAVKDFVARQYEEVPEELKQNWIDELTIKTFKEELEYVFPYIYKLIGEKTKTQEVTAEDFEEAGYQGEVEPHMHHCTVERSGFEPYGLGVGRKQIQHEIGKQRDEKMVSLLLFRQFAQEGQGDLVALHREAVTSGDFLLAEEMTPVGVRAPAVHLIERLV